MPERMVREARDALAFGASKNSSSLSFSIDSTCVVWCQETPVLLAVNLNMHFVVEIISIPITKSIGMVTTK